MAKNNGWSEYKKLFEYLVKKIDKIEENTNLLAEELAGLKEKQRATTVFWGSLGGALAVLVSVVIRMVS